MRKHIIIRLLHKRYYRLSAAMDAGRDAATPQPSSGSPPMLQYPTGVSGPGGERTPAPQHVGEVGA